MNLEVLNLRYDLKTYLAKSWVEKINQNMENGNKSFEKEILTSIPIESEYWQNIKANCYFAVYNAHFRFKLISTTEAEMLIKYVQSVYFLIIFNKRLKWCMLFKTFIYRYVLNNAMETIGDLTVQLCTKRTPIFDELLGKKKQESHTKTVANYKLYLFCTKCGDSTKNNT